MQDVSQYQALIGALFLDADVREESGGVKIEDVLVNARANVVVARLDVDECPQGIGLQIAYDLVAKGLTVLVGSRNLANGEAAALDIGAGARAVQLDVTDARSIAAAATLINLLPPAGMWAA